MSKPVDGNPIKDAEMTATLDKLQELIKKDQMNNYGFDICERMVKLGLAMTLQGNKYGIIRTKQAWKGKNTKPVGKDKIRVSCQRLHSEDLPHISHIKPCPQQWIDDVQDVGLRQFHGKLSEPWIGD